MPRKRAKRSHTIDTEDTEDDDFFCDDSQSSSGRNCLEPQHRNAANARERARMRVLSKAFCRLKTTLPWVPADTKLSKLDTLRLAASYIAHLRALLQDEPRTAAQMFPHPLNLAWPFSFQHGGAANSPESPRWNNPCTEKSHEIRQSRIQDSQEYQVSDRYEFAETEKRYYHEDSPIPNNGCGTNVQYCNYPYRESYYEMKNSYANNI